ncbi:hypothetical protein ACA365_08150 [Enterobacter roggenkampii]|uniref:hypothetical protein n=1 Tax=Enterobacter roggenkampii TaxID=1812935 RepID=UPI003BA030E8
MSQVNRGISMSTFFLISVLPLGTLFFYIIPAIISYFINSDVYSFEMMTISSVSILFYTLVLISNFDKLLFPFKTAKFNLNLTSLSKGIVISYSLLMLYTALTAPTIPLLDALRGSGIDVISNGRETFLRTRTGWEVVLNYFFAMYRSVLMPFAVCWLFYAKNSWRYFSVIIFLFTLLLTLEKSVCVIALIPLFFLFFQIRPKVARRILYVTIILVAATSFLARGGISSESTTSDLSSVPDKYNIFKSDSQFFYVINRIFFIPYATSVDWLKYRDSRLNGNELMGRNISIIASMKGEEKLNTEREVFEFQWGQNESGTGSANTSYFVDSYIGWGVFGVLIYNLIIVFIIRCAIRSDIFVVKACTFVPLVFLLFNSLSAMIFSGGLFILVFISLFLYDRSLYIGRVRNELVDS